jgi:hypothetical protein
MELNSKKTVSAMTLLDAVLALAMFGIFFGFIVNLLFLGQDSVIVSGKRQQAALLTQEAVAAVESIVRRDFRNIGSGDYALSTSSNRYSLSSSSVEHLGIFDRTINITAIDYLSRAVTVTVSWMQNLQRSGSISMAYNLYNWALGFVYDHGKVKFDANYRNSVQVSTSGSTSSVGLLRAGDWGRTILFKAYDMTGSTVASDVAMYRYYLYVSKLISAGGPELVRLDGAGADAETLTRELSHAFPLLPILVALKKRDARRAVALMRAGAAEVIAPPWTREDVKACVSKSLRWQGTTLSPIRLAFASSVLG